jgi:ATP-binding cassette subfamily F protein 3
VSKITVQNVEKSYGGETLFSSLSFEAQPGMRLAVAGPNGTGKSTLLRIWPAARSRRAAAWS